MPINNRIDQRQPSVLSNANQPPPPTDYHEHEYVVPGRICNVAYDACGPKIMHEYLTQAGAMGRFGYSMFTDRCLTGMLSARRAREPWSLEREVRGQDPFSDLPRLTRST